MPTLAQSKEWHGQMTQAREELDFYIPPSTSMGDQQLSDSFEHVKEELDWMIDALERDIKQKGGESK